MMRRHHTPAQAMIEFALAGMAFFSMLFGTIEFGRVLWTNHELANGTREGARFAMVNGTAAGGPATAEQVEAAILDRVAGISGDILSVTVTYADGPDSGTLYDKGNADFGDTVIVRTTYTFDFIVGQLLGVNSINLVNQSEVTVLR